MLKANIQKVFFNFDNNKYNFYIRIEVPFFSIKNELNFRIFQIKKNKKEYIRDPEIKDSKYIYNISKEDFGGAKNILFEFNKNSFEEIDEFFFDFCDENYKWLNFKTFYKNKHCKNINLSKNNTSILSEDLLNYLNSEEFLKITNE